MTEQELFREHVRAIWREVSALGRSGEFDNLEGGSVDQRRDKRLLLHHCANYAAVLTLLSPTGQTSPTGRASAFRLLELGCGSGALSCAFARVMPQDWQLVATDYSESLLAGARVRFQASNLRFEHLDVRTAETSRLREADAVFLLEVIEHLPEDEARALLHRLYQALHPGARLVLTTLDRSPFPRAFSGYAPHFVEYDFRSLNRFLSGAGNSPFERHWLYRLASSRIAGEAVRGEERGGYLVNRYQRLVLGLSRRHPEVGAMRERLERMLFRVYACLPETGGFDLEDYLSTLDFVRLKPETRDRDSFGLVAVLEKTGGTVLREESDESPAC